MVSVNVNHQGWGEWTPRWFQLLVWAFQLRPPSWGAEISQPCCAPSKFLTRQSMSLINGCWTPLHFEMVSYTGIVAGTGKHYYVYFTQVKSLAQIIRRFTKWWSPKLARQIGSRVFVVFFPDYPPNTSMKVQPGSLLWIRNWGKGASLEVSWEQKQGEMGYLPGKASDANDLL